MSSPERYNPVESYAWNYFGAFWILSFLVSCL
jgi:hypothetical protein